MKRAWSGKYGAAGAAAALAVAAALSVAPAPAAERIVLCEEFTATW